MSIFNDYLEESFIVSEYDAVTGITFETYSMSFITEAYYEMKESVMQMNCDLYLMEVMNAYGLSDPLLEGVVSSTKEFFRKVVEKLKAFLEAVKNFFSNIFKKLEINFSQNGKAFIDKYSEGLTKAFNSGKAEWIEYNERYVLTNKEHENVFSKLDGVVKEYDTYISMTLNSLKSAIRNAKNTSTTEASTETKDTPTENKPEEKNNSDKVDDLEIKEALNKIDEARRDHAKKLYSKAESFDDVKAIFNKETSQKDKDTQKVLDSAVGLKLLDYCKKHVTADLVTFKNAQTNMNNLINHVIRNVNELSNIADTNTVGSLNEWYHKYCNASLSDLGFFQEMNSKRVSTRTQTFDYYIKLLKRFTKKNFKLVVNGVPEKNSDEEESQEESSKTNENDKKKKK